MHQANYQRRGPSSKFRERHVNSSDVVTRHHRCGGLIGCVAHRRSGGHSPRRPGTAARTQHRGPTGQYRVQRTAVAAKPRGGSGRTTRHAAAAGQRVDQNAAIGRLRFARDRLYPPGSVVAHSGSDHVGSGRSRTYPRPSRVHPTGCGRDDTRTWDSRVDPTSRGRSFDRTWDSRTDPTGRGFGCAGDRTWDSRVDPTGCGRACDRTRGNAAPDAAQPAADAVPAVAAAVTGIAARRPDLAVQRRGSGRHAVCAGECSSTGRVTNPVAVPGFRPALTPHLGG
jgi:hypothetical protein